jgi:Fe-S oxidoreductase
MCNNNGHCRKFDAGTMCPSFRVTGDEQHLTRGRANTLRLALSGQLGPAADEDVKAALDLCVSCKGCKRECPTGVDMARMKIEFLAHYHARRGLRLRERLIAWLPRYAPLAARAAPAANALQRATGRVLGFAPQRGLPPWRADFFRDAEIADAPGEREAVLFVDCFNRWFEPENARAALKVLGAAGYAVRRAQPAQGARPLCCGRTFLAAGLVKEARREARRLIDALRPFAERGVALVGLEPSCTLGLRDELLAMLPGRDAAEIAARSLLLEEFLAREADAGRLKLRLKPAAGEALLHGHCHQKAFDCMPAVERTLRLVPGLKVRTIDSSCCGMAGAFGYEAEHYDISMKMAEAALLPEVRAAGTDALIVAGGTSCRQQIAHGAAREALHVAQVLARALAA